MIIPSKTYKINKKTSKIIERQIIQIKCDRCNKIWETKYGFYKKKKLIKDYCRSCKNTLGISGVKGGHSKKSKQIWKKKGLIKTNQYEITCDFCKTKKEIYVKLLNKTHNFCSIKCKNNFYHHKNYDNLINTSLSNKNKNEIAYFVGLILGDGSIAKGGSKTKRIHISFNSREKKLISIAEQIAYKLQIKYGKRTEIKHNCTIISTTMPNIILNKWKILFIGDKFKNQPFPKQKIIKNINYAAGLINSDGYHGKGRISFCNTVISIIKSLSICLKQNNIQYKQYMRKQKNVNWKDVYEIRICKKNDREKLIKLCDYRIKGIKK
jgi:hypothetical protein